MTKLFRLHTAISVASIAAVLLVSGLYIYLYYQSGVFTDQAVVTRDALRNEEIGQVEHNDVRALYDATASERAGLSSYFVHSDDAVAFIQALESVGSASGAAVAISSIAADKLDSAAPGTIGLISANVNVNGSWSNVMRALKLLETLPYRSSIDNVSLVSSGSGSTGADEQSARSWQLSLSVSASTLASPSPQQ